MMKNMDLGQIAIGVIIGYWGRHEIAKMLNGGAKPKPPGPPGPPRPPGPALTPEESAALAGYGALAIHGNPGRTHRPYGAIDYQPNPYGAIQMPNPYGAIEVPNPSYIGAHHYNAYVQTPGYAP